MHSIFVIMCCHNTRPIHIYRDHWSVLTNLWVINILRKQARKQTSFHSNLTIFFMLPGNLGPPSFAYIVARYLEEMKILLVTSLLRIFIKNTSLVAINVPVKKLPDTDVIPEYKLHIGMLMLWKSQSEFIYTPRWYHSMEFQPVTIGYNQMAPYSILPYNMTLTFTCLLKKSRECILFFFYFIFFYLLWPLRCWFNVALFLATWSEKKLKILPVQFHSMIQHGTGQTWSELIPFEVSWLGSFDLW